MDPAAGVFLAIQHIGNRPTTLSRHQDAAAALLRPAFDPVEDAARRASEMQRLAANRGKDWRQRRRPGAAGAMSG
jgi:hypothetical protein